MGTVYRTILVKKQSVFKIKRRLVDRLYSNYLKIVRKDKCQKCGTQHKKKSKGLHVSHFFSRARESTRFDLRNTDLLCLACHLFFTHNRGKYVKWKVKQIGKDQYLDLLEKSKIPNSPLIIKKTDKVRIEMLKKEIDTLTKLSKTGILYCRE